MSIFDKYAAFLERYQMAEMMPKNPLGMRFDEILTPTRARVDGREIILAGTNNYLGLTFDEDAKAAAAEAIAHHGTGTTGSRMANGSYAEHQDLEAEIADWLGMKSCIVFTTGYQTNLAAIGTLAGRDDLILIDADSHASIYDACRMSDAKMVRFKHNRPDDLDQKLERLLPETKGSALVVVEGLYSMFGDIAPLGEFAAVCEKHGAYFFVDEAHSVGVYGEEGRGVADMQGVLDKVDFFSGTFSKSLASVGGFCTSRHAEFDRIRSIMRPYTFTASASPATIASTRVTLAKLREGEGLRQNLWARAEQLHAGLSEMGFTLCAEPSPIVAVRRSSDLETVMGWQQLMQAGVYVNLAVPPATPKGACLLRLSLSAAHTEDDIDAILGAFAQLAEQGAVAVAAE
ncbi:serine palmitoyltransferase [Parvularcula dongshanensis]|uniref:8-amino-7-oxononanoate synthase n=1 Tax=Parvularcula dongshanensis TaxID=1173995 RepID=A0A840I4G5_9PROT|nr:aminotransferase class I/II-fold pyridoxal phosphate-dependent enzyme [Parvularcula dongshanensis]MBB4659171.1 8-amino-7-oxononanoate synthase [Parvularcula dongshanensis]